MVYAGTSITSSADKLAKVTIEYLYNSIRNPKPEIAARISQLRVVRDLDAKRYAAMKKALPYIVCGCFSPPFRRTENFAFIECFFIDIDHLGEKGLDISQTRAELQQDSRVVLCFLSPGEDGLKVLFRLKEKCYDHGVYSLFYKQFIKSFSDRYHLEQVIDKVTSDVCRACFVSLDGNAYYNPSAEPVDMNDYVDESDPQSMFDIKHSFDKQIHEGAAVESQTEHAPGSDELQHIRDILKLKTRPSSKPEAYVPQQLEEIMGDLKLFVEETGLVVTDTLSISYGKKIRMQIGVKQAEVNVFFGKRGFSVVKSPRSGTNAELNDLAAEVISGFISQL